MAVVALGTGGCAMSERADLDPEIDPTLPGVDAAYAPSPAEGGQTLPPKSDAGADDGSTTVAPTDSGTPIVDSGPPETAPPTSKPAPGEVLISEVMYDTSGTEPATEWFELHSKAASLRSLTGLTIEDGAGRTHVIGAGITIAPGAYIVLARTKSGATGAKVPASVIAYEYAAGLPSNSGVQLANGATGGVSLTDGATVITSAPYGGWFVQSGGSTVQLTNLNGPASTSKANWCLSSSAWTAGSDKGTPGAAEDCP